MDILTIVLVMAGFYVLVYWTVYISTKAYYAARPSSQLEILVAQQIKKDNKEK